MTKLEITTNPRSRPRVNGAREAYSSPAQIQPAYSSPASSVSLPISFSSEKEWVFAVEKFISVSVLTRFRRP